jgi:high-affinity iron transporter
MFLNAVILVLQEILEASLLLALLLVLVRLQPAALHLRNDWALLSVVCGVIGSWAFATATATISAWFDNVGQEVVSAALQLISIALVLVLGFLWRGEDVSALPLSRAVGAFCLVIIVVIAITREGSEIILYTEGIMAQPESLTPVLLGTVVATGIGLSCGVLLYVILRSLSDRHALRVAVVLLALFAGNQAMQAILLLTQADWMPYTPELWNSSALLLEYSMPGQLLNALIGYEATPSLAQLVGYLAAVAAVACTPLFRYAWRRG